METWDIIGPAMGALVAGPVMAWLKGRLAGAYRAALSASEEREADLREQLTAVQRQCDTCPLNRRAHTEGER